MCRGFSPERIIASISIAWGTQSAVFVCGSTCWCWRDRGRLASSFFPLSALVGVPLSLQTVTGMSQESFPSLVLSGKVFQDGAKFFTFTLLLVGAVFSDTFTLLLLESETLVN